MRDNDPTTPVCRIALSKCLMPTDLYMSTLAPGRTRETVQFRSVNQLVVGRVYEHERVLSVTSPGYVSTAVVMQILQKYCENGSSSRARRSGCFGHFMVILSMLSRANRAYAQLANGFLAKKVFIEPARAAAGCEAHRDILSSTAEATNGCRGNIVAMLGVCECGCAGMFRAQPSANR